MRIAQADTGGGDTNPTQDATTNTVGPVVLNKPAADQLVVISVAQVAAVDFSRIEDLPQSYQRSSTDLFIVFPDGAVIQLQGFFNAETGEPEVETIQFASRALTIAEFLDLFDVGNEPPEIAEGTADGETPQTAGGGTQFDGPNNGGGPLDGNSITSEGNGGLADGGSGFFVPQQRLTDIVFNPVPTASFSGRFSLSEDAVPPDTFLEQSVGGNLIFSGGVVTAIAYVTPDAGTQTGIADSEVTTPPAEIPFTSGGEAVVVTVSPNGLTLTGTTTSGTPVFIVEVTDPATGAFTFTQQAPFDHPDGDESGIDDPLFMTIEFTVTDASGDVATAEFELQVFDDAPVANGADAGTVDEDDLATNGNNDVIDTSDDLPINSDTLATGSLGVDWGADGFDSATGARQDTPTGTANRSVSFDPRLDGAQPSGLTSDSVQIEYVLSTNNTVLTATAGGRPVFVASLNDDDAGSYTFRLLSKLDHDKNDADLEDNIDLDFGFIAIDSDGDRTTGTFTISIDDDAPIFVSRPTRGEVDEDDLAGGNNDVIDTSDDLPINSSTLATGVLGIAWGSDHTDDGTSARQDSPSGTGDRSVVFDPDLDGAEPDGLASDGDQVRYELNDDGTVLTATAGGRPVFIASVNDDDAGSYTFRLQGKLDHDKDDAELEDNIDLDFGFIATDSDGDALTGSFTVYVDDDAPTFVSRPTRGEVDEDDLADGNNDVVDRSDDLPINSSTLATGILGIAWGADDTDDGTSARQDSPSGTGDRSVVFDPDLDGAEPDGLTSDGVQVRYELNDDGTVLTATAGGRPVFIASVNDDDAGSYTFRLQSRLDHNEAGTEDNIDLDFGFIATDSDGDALTGSFTVSVDDDTPVATGALEIEVDEDDIFNVLSRGTSPDGDSVFDFVGFGFAAGATGSLRNVVSFGADGPAESGRFGFKTGAADAMNDLGLLSKGGLVEFAWFGNLLFGYVDVVGGIIPDPFLDRPVMLIGLNPATGGVGVRLFDQLDHIDSDGENTALKTDTTVNPAGRLDFIDFGAILEATDGDGDTIPLDGKVVLNIRDDIPELVVEIVDYVRIDETYGLHSDNVFDEDNQIYDPDVVGLFSSLNAEVGLNPPGPDGLSGAIYARFNVLDGDFRVGADEPVANFNVDLIVRDGANSGLSTTEREVVRLFKDGDLVVGRVGQREPLDDSGEIVFALHIDDFGRVSIVQFKSLLHTDPGTSDEFEQIRDGTLFAQVSITDNDGDVVSTDLLDIGANVTFDDDGPETIDDTNMVVEGDPTVISGNVLTNDEVGADDPGRIAGIVHNGTIQRVPDGGSLTIDQTAAGGKLVISSDGSYEYTAPDDFNHFSQTFSVRDQFEAESYSNEDGTARWASTWVEDDGGQPDDGSIRIVQDRGDGALEFSRGGRNGGRDGIERSVDLTGAYSAILSFDYRESVNRDNEDVRVFVSADGIDFDLLIEVDDDDPGNYTSVSFDISDYISDTTTIRITVDDDFDRGDEIYIDNLDITYILGENPVEEFDYLLIDSDGDTEPGTLEITVKDTVPTIGRPDTNRFVDEDDLRAGNSDDADGDDLPDPSIPTAAGDLDIDWGADDADQGSDGREQDPPGGIGDRSVTFDPAIAAPVGLTSNNVQIEYVLNDDKTILKAYRGPGRDDRQDLVFDLQLSDDDDGGYRFFLIGNLDHSEPGIEDDIDLTFGFIATDADGSNAGGEFTVKVDDDLPVAVDDTVETDEDTPVEIDVLTNDKFGADGESSQDTIVITANPANGTAEIVNGKVEYTPDENYSGPDSISYTIEDGDGDVSKEASIAITVTPVADAPVVKAVFSAASVLEPTTSDIQINSSTQGDQFAPTLAVLNEEQILAVWTSRNTLDQDDTGIFGQILSNDGQRIGNEFKINGFGETRPSNPTIVRLSDGNLLVAWNQEPFGASRFSAVYGQLVTDSGSLVGTQFRLDVTTNGSVSEPAIVPQEDEFIAIWTNNQEDSLTVGLFGQRYGNDGLKIGEKFRINSLAQDAQRNASAANLEGENYVVVWESSGTTGISGELKGVYFQIFDGNDQKIGNETRANTTTRDVQQYADVSKLANGNFIIVWASNDQDGDN
ncbi:MAG: DUF5801 repeats-in-toxin domain-containing protein, partial [Pseudomonadota bacterium]